MATRSIVLTVTLALVLGAGAAAAQTVQWTLAEEYPASSIPGEGDRTLAELVARSTGGRIAVTPHFDAALGYRSRQALDAVADGRIALADMFAGALGAADPFFLLSSLPFLAVTPGQARQLFDAAADDYRARLAARRQKLLLVSPWPPSGMWAKRPVTEAAALQGLKVRTNDSTATETLRRLGALPSQVSFADVMPKLRSGELDAVLSSGDGGAGAQLWEVLDHFTELNYAMPISLTTIGLDAWNALAPDLQAAVTAAAAETEARQWALVAGRVEANYRQMREHGVAIDRAVAPALAAALQQAGAAAVADWVKAVGPAGAEVMTRYRAMAK